MNVLVLGAGLVGRPMAADLAAEHSFSVTVADVSEINLARFHDSLAIRKVKADLSDKSRLGSLLESADLVVSAVPGHLGHSVLREIISAGRDVVDIAFFPEDPFDLDALAKQKNVTAVVDCGVAPGMSNMLAGYVHTLLDTTETILIYVGGLPVVRDLPFEYRAGFSPIDVIEEYTRPARYVENGALVVRPALSEPEFVRFPGIGTLEAFNSDGLRSLAVTMNVPNMKEKTLRYPGHIEKMALLRDVGFFGREAINLDGMRVRPIDLTSKLLFPLWELKEGERDFTVMTVIVEGTSGSKKIRYVYDLLDYFNEQTSVHSMARTTGYTATAVVRMLAKGMFRRKGICPPEYIGAEPKCVEFVLAELKKRGVEYKQTIQGA
jgi:lysine 6-dehydrogenase